MGASDEVGTLRWTRCIVELVRSACHMCPTSMGVAYLEMLHKLSRYAVPESCCVYVVLLYAKCQPQVVQCCSASGAQLKVLPDMHHTPQLTDVLYMLLYYEGPTPLSCRSRALIVLRCAAVLCLLVKVPGPRLVRPPDHSHRLP